MNQQVTKSLRIITRELLKIVDEIEAVESGGDGRRRMGDAQKDVATCVKYLNATDNDRVHIRALLAFALNQPVTIRNQNRLCSALLFNAKQKGDIVSFGRGYYGLKEQSK